MSTKQNPTTNKSVNKLLAGQGVLPVPLAHQGGITSKIRSKYILLLILSNLMKKKSLDIIKYNNNIKERVNISIKDYKEYLEIYSPIEIELEPVDNEYGKFININKENEKYFHIYFNNKKEEIKRNFLKKNELIYNKIKIIIDYQVKSFEELFYNCECIKYINFKKFYRNNIDNMGYMFDGCFSLREINLSNFNTSNVTNMKFMFGGCTSLKEINLSNFNTDKVTNMEGMFNACFSLKKFIFLKKLNTKNVTSMRCMFAGCSALKELDLSNFDTNNVANMRYMFYNCPSLKN